jgi:transcriptional regulator with XRE-family HTH domain
VTPFGQRVRELRAQRGITLAEMAEGLGVTPAYLSALEHGKRGRPTFTLIQGAIHLLGIIWDEADELVRLADLSHPRVTIDTAGLEPEATLLANRLSREIAELDSSDLQALTQILDKAAGRHGPGNPSERDA